MSIEKNVTWWENIVLTHSTRGYGRCNRLYDRKTKKAIDFFTGGEYQRSVHPVSGEYEKIKELLDAQPQKVRQAIIDLNGDLSECDLHRQMSFEQLQNVIEGMTMPLPKKQLIEECQKFKSGENNSFIELCDHIFNLDYITGYKKGKFHKFMYVLRNSMMNTIISSKGNRYKEVGVIKILYPDETGLIDMTKTYCDYIYRNR